MQVDNNVLQPVEPARRQRTWVLWVGLAVLVAAIMWMQAMGQAALSGQTQSANQPTVMFRMLGRYTLGAHRTGMLRDADLRRMIEDVEEMASAPADQLRLAMLEAELLDPSESIQRLRGLYTPPPEPPEPSDVPESRDNATSLRVEDIWLVEPWLDSQPPAWVQQDAKALIELYTHGVQALDADTRDRLLDHHGWFAQLALSHEQPNSPLRKQALASVTRTMVAFFAAAVAGVFGLLVGFVLLIVAVVMIVTGAVRSGLTAHGRPEPSPALLETLILFLLAMIAMGVVGGIIEGVSGVDASWALMWLVPVTLLWPLARRVPVPQWRRALGLYRGSGVFREIALGLVGYIAGLPIVALGVLVTFVLITISQTNSSHPVVQDTPLDGGALGVVALYLLACVWAPLFEEMAFRGAFYHHVRSRWNAVVSALIVGLIFAAIHPQGWAAIPALGSIAFVLAMLREWRGSIIAPVAAHALNNGTLITMLVTAAW